MGIATELARIKTAKSNLKTAINAKGGGLVIETLDYYAAAVNALPSGTTTPTISESSVNFYDYNGTLIAGYTIAEAQALTALPTANDHSSDDVPLTFQEWNYTLSQVNATTTKLNVGATYKPTDSKTHLEITVNTVTGGVIPFYFEKSNASDTLSIAYGDGQTDTDSTNTSVIFTPTTPLSNGDYDVVVWISSGSGTFTLGQGSSDTVVVGGATQNYRSTLREIYIGDGVTNIGYYAFDHCSSLTSIIIPNSVTSIEGYMFYYCYSLTSIIIPNSVTSIGNYAFGSCYSLTSIIIPNNVTSIGTSAFGNCYSLTSIIIPNSVTILDGFMFYYCYSLTSIIIPNSVTSIEYYVFRFCYSLTSTIIPNSVTSIGTSAFDKCYSIQEYDFSACSSVPTLLDINAFTNINAICIMKIPSALYDIWSTATNWATYADYMVSV